MSGKHPTFNMQHPKSQSESGGCVSGIECPRLGVRGSLFFFLVLGLAAFGATNDSVAPEVPAVKPEVGDTARELYNAGTARLRAGKLDDAETLFESALARQDARVQPEALFNVGYTRFGQGMTELKKSPGTSGAAERGLAAKDAGTAAIQNAEDALAGNDVQQMVRAYLAGHGTHRELHAASKALRRAMEVYGKTLSRWRRALGDFQSAAELNPADTNAVRNAEIVQQAIARLVDSLREMQQTGAQLGPKEKQLGDLLKQLRGRIPAGDLPAGAPGQGEEDDEDGQGGILPEDLAGLKESNAGGGQQMELKISPETAGQLLEGIQPDGKLLPMGEGQTGTPKNRSGRNW